jgi:Helix-turn-helix domain
METQKLSPQCQTLLRHLEAGHRLTPLVAAFELGVMALSQRMGELRRAGHPILVETVKLPSGKRVAGYSLAREV